MIDSLDRMRRSQGMKHRFRVVITLFQIEVATGASPATTPNYTRSDDDKYTVIVSDQRFVLTKAQIQVDSPNYFTKRFFGNTPEAHSRTLELTRDPDLFRLVVDYLSYYWVIPLNTPSIPPRSAYRTLNDLNGDAIFYELDKLKAACSSLLPAAKALNETCKKDAENEKFVVLTGVSRLDRNNSGPGARILCTFHSADAELDLGQAFAQALGTYAITNVGQDKLSHSDFSNLSTPESCQGFTGIRELGMVQTVATKVLKARRIDDWRLVGWKSSTDGSSEYHIVIVVELRRSREYVWCP
jgi:hypothetical protein